MFPEKFISGIGGTSFLHETQINTRKKLNKNKNDRFKKTPQTYFSISESAKGKQSAVSRGDIAVTEYF